MSFPEIVGALLDAGIEGYMVDFQAGTAVYYTPDGDTLCLDTHKIDMPVAARFDAAALGAAIREAQQDAPGYTYQGFCRKAALAGCMGYIVSFPGRRALYIGRTAETHVELFPG